MIEEKKAGNRAKTIGITSVLDRYSKMPLVFDQNPIDDFYKVVNDQYDWLMGELNKQRLEETKREDVDVVFKFPTEPNCPEIYCNSSILKSKSSYFEGLLNFNQEDMMSQITQSYRTFDIDSFPSTSFSAMIEFFYTGSCDFDSDSLLDLFEMCQEYLLPDLRQLLESVVQKNVDFENFFDTILLTRKYDLKNLREALFLFGRKNYQELYRKGALKNLSKDEYASIKPPNV